MPRRPVRMTRALAHSSRVAILHALQQSGRPMGVHEIVPELGLHRTTLREHLEHLVAAGYVAKSVEARSSRGRPRILYCARERPELSAADAWFRDNLVRLLLAGYGRPLADPSAEAARAGRESAGRWLAVREPVAEPARVPALEPVSDATGVRDPAPGDAARPDATGPTTAAPDRAGAVGVFSGRAEVEQIALLEAHLEEFGFEPEVDDAEPLVHLRACPYLELARENTEVVCSVHLGLIRGVLAEQPGPVTATRLDPLVEPRHCLLHLHRG